jgi:hypothetical protein
MLYETLLNFKEQMYVCMRGTRWGSWSRHCATSRTMALGSTRPLRLPGIFPVGKGGRCVGLRILDVRVPIIRKYENLSLLKTSGPVQACTRIAFFACI